MTKGQLKEIVAQLEALGVADATVVKVRMNIDNSQIDLNPFSFEVQNKEASYTVDASDHFAETISKQAVVILKQS